MKAGLLISKLLEKTGVDIADEKFKDIFAVSVELPEEYATKLDTELMDKKAAKAMFKNENINEFTTGVYINIDKHLEEMGLTKEERDEVFKEKALGKVVKAYASKIKDITEKANPANTDKEKTLREEVKTLNTQLAEYKDKYVPKEEVEKVQSSWDADKYQMAIESEFMPKKWSDNFTPEVRPALIKTVLDKKLNEMGAKVVVVDGKAKIVKAEDIQSDYFDKSNKIVTFASLADELMLTNKFLAVSTQTSSTSTTVTPDQGGKTNSKKLNHTLSSLLDQSLADQGIV